MTPRTREIERACEKLGTDGRHGCCVSGEVHWLVVGVRVPEE